MRLDKLLSHSGYGSRKEVKEYIRKGNVLVNGEIIRNDDFKINEENDEVVICDDIIDYKNKVYYMLNKPAGYVSARVDRSYPTVTEIIKEFHKDLFPVGRLDLDTTGILILTNDGNIAHKVLSPKFHVDKIYYTVFSGKFLDSYYSMFKNGITLEDGYTTLPAKIELINSTSAYVTISEGKYHQIKRMFAALSLNVLELKRIKFGPLDLDNALAEGEYRKLTEEEIKLLRN